MAIYVRRPMADPGAPPDPTTWTAAARTNATIGSPVTLVSLNSDQRLTIPFVPESAIDSTGRFLGGRHLLTPQPPTTPCMYTTSALTKPQTTQHCTPSPSDTSPNITWDHTRMRIAYTASRLDTARSYAPGDAHIVQWSAPVPAAPVTRPDTLLSPADVHPDFRLRSRNALTWTRDGQRLFYGVMAAEMVAIDEQETPDDSLTASNLYDLDTILRGSQQRCVARRRSPRSKTNEKQTWSRREKSSVRWRHPPGRPPRRAAGHPRNARYPACA